MFSGVAPKNASDGIDVIKLPSKVLCLLIARGCREEITQKNENSR